MRHAAVSASLSALGILFASLRVHGKDLYVSPAGTPEGSGALTQPCDLATALLGRAGQAGDTFWLLGGDYRIGHIDTQIHGEPEQPVTFRSVPGHRVRVDGSITFFDSIGHVVLRDFELYSSDINRASSQSGVGFNPTDIKIVSGVSCGTPNLSFINLIVHDQTRHGFYISETATNNLIHGCVVYNNGWVSPDNAEGHGIYVQGKVGTREISDNLVFNNSGANMHIYENFTGRPLTGVTLDGNVAFNAGAIQNVRSYRDWIVGVDLPAVGADLVVFKNNLGYYSPGSPTLSEVQLGREGTNGSLVLTDNYLPVGLLMNNWRTATVSGNLFGSGETSDVVNLNQSLTALGARWNGNIYLSASRDDDFIWNSVALSFAGWQAATGFDASDSSHGTKPTGTKVFVRPNRFEAGRAHLIVYNWDQENRVSVDVGSVLPVGLPYEVRNAQDFFAPPVLSGVFDSQPLLLPMTGMTVAEPSGALTAPPPTSPTFNVFVLLPNWAKLGIQELNGALKFHWSTNCGPAVLQFNDGLPTTSGWVEVAAEPAVFGDQYVVTNLMTRTTGYYRLRIP